MNLDSLSFALSQISYSVANLTKKNFKNSVAEINRLVTQYGFEAEKHLFRCLFSHVDFTSDGRSSGKDFHQTQYLIQECYTLLSKPNFKSILCCAIDNPLHHQKTLNPYQQLFPQLSKILKLSKIQEVVFSLSLFNSSNSEIVSLAKGFAKQKLPQLLNSYIDASDTGTTAESDFQDIQPEALHLILSHLRANSEQFGVSPDQKEAFLTALRKDLPEDKLAAVLTPLLYQEGPEISTEALSPSVLPTSQLNMEVSLAKMIEELQYPCMATQEECRKTLVQFDVRELTSTSVAEVIAMMVRTPTDLNDPVAFQSLTMSSSGAWSDKPDPSSGSKTWNADIFAAVVKDLAPHLNWKEVIQRLDHPGFIVKGKAGLKLLMHCLFTGLQDVFPIDLIYSKWENTEGQLSWINEALENPDVFCLADHVLHTVATDNLKTPPDDDNRQVATWKSLELVEALLQISESGHYNKVLTIFDYPRKNCSDLLTLALIQITTWNQMKQELLTILMPVILGTSANSGVILHFAWHSQNHPNKIRSLIMHSMAEWYMQGDPQDHNRLSRILDVAQDLKALSMLLNTSPYAFVIDLACMASRRAFLKLDKWIAERIRDHGEQFVQSLILFLKRRCPALFDSNAKDDPTVKNQQLPAETLSTILLCLQAIVPNVSQELSSAIVNIIANANVMMSKARQNAPQNVVGGAKPVGMPALSNHHGEMNMPIGPMDSLCSVVGQLSMDGPGGQTAASSSFPGTLGSLSSSAPGSPGKMFSAISQSSSQAGEMLCYTPMHSAFKPARLQGSLSSAMPPPISQPSSLSGNMMPPSSAMGGVLPPNNSMSGGLPQANPLPGGLPPSLPSGLPPGTSRAQTLAGLSAAAISKPPPNQSGLIASGTPTVPAMSSDNAPGQTFSKEVADEADSYFQCIYNHPSLPAITIDEILDKLKRFKDSTEKKERDVFQCMLRSLFEEYRFFPQYPEKELHITAVLFGGIIEQGLVTYVDLGVALRSVLDALKHPHGSKMYYFGVAALTRFKTRLKDYPQYCQHLASIPHFSELPQNLTEYVEYGARSQEPPSRAQNTNSTAVTTVSNTASSQSGTVTTAGQASSTTTTVAPSKPKKSIAEPTNIDTLLAGTEGKEEVIVPPETTQDKVFFIFNNLSMVNMDQKAVELNENIKEEFLPWASQYLVMKRASIEPNFHSLYAAFIDKLKEKSIYNMVVNETFRNIKILLRSDKGVANFSDRSLLKNLGHWLGMITIAKNKPILHVDIDLKSLVYEAYYKGSQELLYVVPFVAKVVESCSKSKVFKPPNPWTQAIMNTLAELHQEPDLKLNLKFEIEVLCRSLCIDINDLQPKNYLKDPDRYAKLEHQLSPPKPKEQQSSAVPPMSPQPEPSLGLTGGSMGLGLGLNSMLPPPGPGMMMPPNTMGMPMATAASHPAPAAPPTTSTVPVTGATPGVAGPPQPQFSYNDIVLTISGIAQHISINEQLPLLKAMPQLKQLIRPAIERSIQELLPPVVDRSIKIALTTCEQIAKKDFALDSDESRMRHAAHNMVQNMTAGMALITCREPLYMNINTNLKQGFLQQIGPGASQQQKEMVEHGATILAQDNTELACAFIQKTAVEKAIPEIDRKLASEFEYRKHARQEGRRYCDPIVLTYQAERMPEQIRLKVGSVTSSQIAVYEEFARNIPGFLPTSQEVVPNTNLVTKPDAPLAQQMFQTDDITQIYDNLMIELNNQFQQGFVGVPQAQQIRQLHEAVMLARNSREVVTARSLLQKAVDGLLDGLNGTLQADQDLMVRYRECHIHVLKNLQNPNAYGPQWTNKQVTSCLIECREDYKYNVDAVELLIRRHLVNMQSYDIHLAQLMENGLNYSAVAFAMQLVQRFCLDDKHSSNEALFQADFYNTIETLARIATHSKQAPEGLVILIDTIRQRTDGGLLDRAPGGPTSMMHSGISQAREFDDPPGLREKTEYLLREWVNMFHSPQAGRDSTKAFSAFVGQMHSQGILKTDDLITRFFRLCTEMCVDLCYQALAEQTHGPNLVRAKCFHTLDAFVRLIALLVKHSGDSSNTVTKINLLNKVLGIVAGVLLQDHEVRSPEFQQLPYHRIFIMLFIELNAPEHVLESINYQVLTAFCNTYHILRPAKAPGFSYAWLELVSHRVFIGRMLAITPQQRVGGWNMFAQLLIDLFKFLAPFLRNAELSKPTLLLYKGTLRVLLVLLHDFPEFLCDYHYAFCDVIPCNCIQMRNLILSAFPRTMRLPDPFTPHLKVDMLSDINHPPRIMTNFANMIQPASFKKDLDSYLKSRSPVTLLSELRGNLQTSNDSGMRYNLPILNALVLYVGTQAINQIHSKGQTPSLSTIAHSPYMDIFQNLAVDLDTEGRYLFLNAIANQLRYPNSHTHYFSCTLLYLFAEANTEAIQEQITRVLLERLIVNRPHPWGLLITFIELIKNPTFKFWNHEFVRCATEIEKLFDSVSKSCMPRQSQPQQNIREETGQTAT